MLTGYIAKAIVQNEDGKILVLTIGDHTKHPHMSWLPDLPGGIIEKGEDVAEGLAREIREETGIHVEPEHLIKVYEQTDIFVVAPVPICRSLWLMRCADTPRVDLSYEHSEHRWVEYDEFMNIHFEGFYFDNFLETAKDRLAVLLAE